jgi:parallel beta-helix repeat protein
VFIFATKPLTKGNEVSSNVIAYNGLSAVEVSGSSGNQIRGNSIFSNDRLGQSGVFPIKLDPGANGDLAAPILTSATPSSVTGTFPIGVSDPNTTLLDFYANGGAVAGGYYEGQTHLQPESLSYGTDASGKLTFTADVQAPPGSYITATVTVNKVITVVDVNSNTSQFSNALKTSLDTDAALSQLSGFLAAQNRLLKTLNSKKKPPSLKAAQNVLQIERGLYLGFANLVATSFTPGDTAFKTLGLKFLDNDKAIEDRVAAIAKQSVRQASSPRAKKQLRLARRQLQGQITSNLAQNEQLAETLDR